MEAAARGIMLLIPLILIGQEQPTHRILVEGMEQQVKLAPIQVHSIVQTVTNPLMVNRAAELLVVQTTLLMHLMFTEI